MNIHVIQEVPNLHYPPCNCIQVNQAMPLIQAMPVYKPLHWVAYNHSKWQHYIILNKYIYNYTTTLLISTWSTYATTLFSRTNEKYRTLPMYVKFYQMYIFVWSDKVRVLNQSIRKASRTNWFKGHSNGKIDVVYLTGNDQAISD